MSKTEQVVEELEIELRDCSEEVHSLRSELARAHEQIRRLENDLYYAEQERKTVEYELADAEARLQGEVDGLMRTIGDLEYRLARAKRESRYL